MFVAREAIVEMAFIKLAGVPVFQEAHQVYCRITLYLKPNKDKW